MTQPLNIAFLWHHHQPFYKISESGQKPFFRLPWVRLHAVKDYFDMADLLRQFPTVKQTFNFVPSLLLQLNEYAHHDAEDRVLQLTKINAEQLSEPEMAEILDTFFLANRTTMIDPYPRFRELWEKKSNKEPFQTEDWRDLQAWYNLCWIGNSAKRQEPVVSLIQKGRHFTEADKSTILEVHGVVLKKVIPAYKTLLTNGQVELSATPFYHPIIPLLCNSRVAEAPDRSILAESFVFSHPEDADHQIETALRYFEDEFGVAAKGMWPSEGSVSDEAVRCFARHQIQWLATDQEILYHSETDENKPSHLRAYQTKDGPVLFFRDHSMSDAIGFVYANKSADEAVADFINKAEEHRSVILSQGLDPSDHVLSVILDGENCWEYYEDQGETFLRSLFGALESSKDLKTITFSEYLAYPGIRSMLPKITRIHAGSWINHNFDIWFGSHREKNIAWQYLYYARQAVEEQEKSENVSPTAVRAAWESIYIAEGSDWFWWFGDDHQAHNKHLFDELFRFHVRSAYDAVGIPVPSYLRSPIMIQGRTRQVHVPPSAPIKPRLDGRPSHFYEWLDAGVYDAEADGDTMHATEQWIKKIYYGFDDVFLYFRIDFFDGLAEEFQLRPQLKIRMEFESGREHWFQSTPSVQTDAVFGEIFEARMECPEVDRQSGLSVSISVWDGERELVRRPSREPLKLIVADARFDKYLWSI